MQSLELEVSHPPLGATLFLPSQPRAAALILQGSGVHDRDGAMTAFNFPSTLYKRLACDLAERCGLAVLRYDKRGARDTADALRDYSVASRLADAEAALMVLGGSPDLAGLPRFLVGHSEGAMLAARLAHSRPGMVDGVISLAAPFGNVFELNRFRARKLAQGRTPEVRARGEAALDFYGKLEALFKSGRSLSPAEFRQFALPWRDLGYSGWESYEWLRQHWQGVLDSDPTLEGLAMLVVQGGRDNRLWDDNVERWRQWCEVRPLASFLELPDMGHDLNDARRKAFVIHEELVPAIARWLENRAGRA